MEDNDPPKRRGRKPSGKSRSEIVRESRKRHLKALAEEGKKPLNAYVSEQALHELDALKESMDLDSRGQVVEVLAAAEIKRRHLKLTYET